MTEAPDKLRIDKWLWHARFFKSRGLAGEVAASGAVRVNGERIAKAAHAVRPGDVLTFPQGRAIRVIRVLGLGQRRGPAAEAQALYDDLDPPVRPEPGSAAAESPPRAEPPRREPGAGRPTKRERRDIDALRGRDPCPDP
ncbi:MAG TPA: RNA-binding S4 domain-containing protein [Paracoccaceae bacterium]|nr:RNA-binding S4 domain-containing protein [Paracoccaceae bacterium]